MKGLIQRVTTAKVEVEDEVVGSIGAGILLFLGIEAEDTDQKCRRLVEKVVNYRIFPDDTGRMNLSLLQTSGDILVVSQFTLVADTRKGTRPGFSSSADPEKGLYHYQQFTKQLEEYPLNVETGQFGADMQVSLLNDGPVTFLLEV